MDAFVGSDRLPLAWWEFAERIGAKALLHSVYDQPDPDAVHAQFDACLSTPQWGAGAG